MITWKLLLRGRLEAARGRSGSNTGRNRQPPLETSSDPVPAPGRAEDAFGRESVRNAENG